VTVDLALDARGGGDGLVAGGLDDGEYVGYGVYVLEGQK